MNGSRPGDHVMWKTEEQKRHVIVQSVNSRERVAQVRPSDKDAVEVASVLELDPHGGSDWSAVSPVEGLGLHRGEFVFIHKEGSSNGADAPMVPRIGELEEWVRESSPMRWMGATHPMNVIRTKQLKQELERWEKKRVEVIRAMPAMVPAMVPVSIPAPVPAPQQEQQAQEA